MKIDGGCHCGFIRYEAEVDPDNVRICHCADCQTLSGSAFRVNVPAKAGSFKLIQGEPKIYVKTAASGNRRAQAFCPNCGAAIYATSADENMPKIYGLRVGTIRQRHQLVPAVQYWHGAALGWLGNLNAIRTVETQ